MTILTSFGFSKSAEQKLMNDQSEVFTCKFCTEEGELNLKARHHFEAYFMYFHMI